MWGHLLLLNKGLLKTSSLVNYTYTDRIKVVSIFIVSIPFLYPNCRFWRTHERRSIMEQKEKTSREMQAEEQVRQARPDSTRSAERKGQRREKSRIIRSSSWAGLW